MAEAHRNPGHGPAPSIWTLRLAGSQDDANASLWSEHARSADAGLAGWLGAAMRNRPLFLSVFLLTLAPVAYWAMLAKPSYDASLRIYVKAAAERGAEPAPAGPEEIATEVEAIRGSEILSAAAEESGVEVEDLERNLRVEQVPDSSLISVGYSSEDPELAADVVNTVAGKYLATRVAPEPEPAEEPAAESKLPIYEMAVQQARRELADFRREYGGALVSGELQAAKNAAADIGAQKAALEVQIGLVETRLGLLNRQAGALEGSRLRSLLGELESERGELEGRYPVTHPLMRELDNRLQAASAAFERAQTDPASEPPAASALRQTIATEADRAQRELAAMRARHVDLQGTLRTAEGRSFELERMAVERGALEQAVRQAEANWERQAREVEEAPAPGINGVRRLNASVVAAATPAEEAAGDHRSTLLLLGLLAALCAAFFAANAYDRRRRPVASVANITAATGAPVLMMIEETHSHVS